MRDPLPIDPYLAKIAAALQTADALLISAPPGAGKTTRIPRALHEAGFTRHGEILILEPRRLAARLAAFRLAQEFGEKTGETVGYSIRFENVAGPKTRIRFITEAILARRIIQDPHLAGISVVILDEFHERHLTTDLSLALLRRLQEEKSAPKIMVMSATLDAQPVASFLSNASQLSIAGSPFDLSIEYENKATDRPLHEKVASAVLRVLRSGTEGDILIFLPGAAEIRRSAEALNATAARYGLRICLLHGELPSSEQRRALEPCNEKKLILATNVAETSITIPGIATVIDSGLARMAGHSPWSGFPTLSTARISKSSAIQRAGRAGRTRAGRVLRLYTRPEFDARPEHETPEIKRADLTETVLMLHGAGIRDARSFRWFDSPPDPALSAAEALLTRLGAINENGGLSAIGARMVKMPVHPRLARLILEGERLHIADESTLLAALLSERDIRLDVRAGIGRVQSEPRRVVSGSSDLLELLDRFYEAEEARFAPERVAALGLDLGVLQSVRRAKSQLRRTLSHLSPAGSHRLTGNREEEALLVAALTAFPDRVARRRTAGSRELLLAAGGSATLSRSSVVHEPMFVIAADAEEKVSRGIAGTMIRLASAIEIEWLAALFPDGIVQKTELAWNSRAGRVDEYRRTCFEQITLEETVHPAAPSEEASGMLAAAVFASGLSLFRDLPALQEFRSRLALLSRRFPAENWPDTADDAVHDHVKRMCRGKCSIDELVSLSLVDTLRDVLTKRQRALLERETPERIRLKSGRTVKVHYELAKPPWIASRLQDFFGMLSTPVICGGEVALTLHLLAPNGRAVQVTQDVAGFWKNHYPAIRRELMRRYPTHAWPEL